MHTIFRAFMLDEWEVHSFTKIPSLQQIIMHSTQHSIPVSRSFVDLVLVGHKFPQGSLDAPNSYPIWSQFLWHLFKYFDLEEEKTLIAGWTMLWDSEVSSVVNIPSITHDTIELFMKSFKEGLNLHAAHYFRVLCWMDERYVLIYDNSLSTWVWSFFEKIFY